MARKRVAMLFLVLLAAALLAAPSAAPQGSGVTAKLEYAGSTKQLKFTLENGTGAAIDQFIVELPAGTKIVSVQGPAGCQQVASNAFGCENPVPPGGTVVITIVVADNFPVGGGGTLHWAQNRQVQPDKPVTGPPPVTPAPCRCKSLKLKLDPTLLNKTHLRSDKHAFGVGFTWTMRCTAGGGGCKGRVRFRPPEVLAGSVPQSHTNFHLNIKRATVTCNADCGKAKSGRFEIKMLSREQLNKLFGRTLAYRVRTKCPGGATQNRTVRVFVDNHGVIRSHP